MDSAQLLTTLSDSKIGAILTHAIITADAKYVISIESENFLIWDLEEETIIFKERQNNVKNLILGDNDTKAIITEQIAEESNIKKNVMSVRSIPNGNVLFQIEFNSSNRSETMSVITKDNNYIVIPVVDSDYKDILAVYRLENGLNFHNIKLEKIKFNELISLRYRGKETVVGLISADYSYIFDIYTQRIMTKIQRWNGQISSDGKFGLFSSNRGGLELIDLKYGSTIKILIPQTSEGVINVMTGFTSDNDYVYYYHTIKKTIR